MKSSRKQDTSPTTSFLQGLAGTLPPSQSRWNGTARAALVTRQIFALVLIVLIVPMGQGALLFAQEAPPQQQQYNGPPPPPPPDQGQDQYGPQDQGGPPPDQGAPQGQPLSPDELGQLVAPIALYPDALVAQVLAASTYPTQVVEADRWVQSQGNVPAEQLAAAANAQNWDPSVKALVAFPSVLAQMDKNIQWTTDLGNAYYNQPDDVMSAIQTMRGRAQAAGTLHNTPQQDVSDEDGSIAIAPANPDVVYVPVYNPWGVYGTPIGVYPGYYYGPPAGVYFGSGLAIGFGIGIGIGIWSGWDWGWHNWGFNWRSRAVWYHGGRYYTHSRTVYNRGFNRPGSPHGYPGSRGSYYNCGGNYNRGGTYNRGAQQNRSGTYNRGAQQNRGGTYNRGAQQNRSGTYNRGAQQNRGTQPRGNQSGNRGAATGHAQSGGGRPSGGGHEGGGRPSGGGEHSGGGHEGGGHHR
ncbi:MAG: DUF3300 domain-containing protein [Acidobacteriaceae bacterium]